MQNEKKSVHKIEILLLFTFLHSLRKKVSGENFHPGVSLILTTPLEAEVTRTIILVIVEKTLKTPEVRYLIVGDTWLLGAWRKKQHTAQVSDSEVLQSFLYSAHRYLIVKSTLISNVAGN